MKRARKHGHGMGSTSSPPPPEPLLEPSADVDAPDAGHIDNI